MRNRIDPWNARSAWQPFSLIAVLLVSPLVLAFGPANAAVHAAGNAAANTGASKDEIPSKIKNDLSSKWEKDRQTAVRKLVDIGTEEAWLLVLNALKDSKGQVADEVQIRLASEVCPQEIWQRLYGDDGLGHKDPWVRLRAAEVLARISGDVLAESLVKTLNKREPLVSTAVLRSIARLQARGALQWGKRPERELTSALRTMQSLLRVDGECGAQALLAICELGGPDAESLCLKNLSAKHALMRCASPARPSAFAGGGLGWQVRAGLTGFRWGGAQCGDANPGGDR